MPASNLRSFLYATGRSHKVQFHPAVHEVQSAADAQKVKEDVFLKNHPECVKWMKSALKRQTLRS